MKTFSQYVTEADTVLDPMQPRIPGQTGNPRLDAAHGRLEEFKQLLEKAASTSDLVVDVSNLSQFARALYVTVQFERHPGNFTEESPGVTVMIDQRGQGFEALFGFYDNWSRSSEGTQFKRTEKRNYRMGDFKDAADIVNRAARMLTQYSNHDPDAYTAADHAAHWNSIKDT
jgi:hypothetical protein